MKEDFQILSYDRHRVRYQETFDHEKLKSWKNKDTTDYWRHERMYSNLDPIIETNPGSTWLTVGDGRYGTDANYILSKGVKDVLATDISDTYLKIAHNEGFISDFKTENAESLSFDSNSFDFVLCKEAYHHFPRPMVALYEMLRVVKKSVILIEPQDANVLIPSRFKLRTIIKWSKQIIKDQIKLLINKEPYYNYGNYEEAGNYVYTISEREIEKVALGLNFEMISFKGINDHYLSGVEFEKRSENSPLFKQINKSIQKNDLGTKNGTRVAGLLVAIIHKSAPNQNTLEHLEKTGFVNRKLSRNPFI